MIKNFLILTFVFGILAPVILPKNGYSNTELKIGVVDLSSIFEQYTKRKTFDKDLKEIEKRHENAINEKRQTITLLKEEAELLDLGSESRRKKEDAIQEKSIELEVYAKFAEQNLLKKYRDYFETIYKDVSNEVQRYGKENGFDLIFKNEEPELKSGEITDLQFKIGIKSVLYYSDAVNITPQIIKKINETYSAKEKK